MQIEHNGISWATRFGVIESPHYGTVYVTELNETDGMYLVSWKGVDASYSDVIRLDEPSQRGIFEHIDMVEFYANS